MLEEAAEEVVVRLELVVVLLRLRTQVQTQIKSFSPHTGEPRVTLEMSMEPAVVEAAVEVLVLEAQTLRQM